MRVVRLMVGLVLVLSLGFTSMPLWAEPSSSVLIAELQTGSHNSASEEFIELVNKAEDTIDLSSWRLEYYSASSNFAAPTRSLALHGSLATNQHYLLASTNYLSDTADQSFAATLAKTGGHLRLINVVDGQVIERDRVGWGTAQHPEGTAAPAPPDGSSLLRQTDDHGQFLDTDNNANDFAISDTPSPQSTAMTAPTDTPPADPGSTPPPPSDQSPPPDDQPPATNELMTPEITELLPNPASPARDDRDEFVELYNANDQTFDLKGYTLQTGTNSSYSFRFANEQLAPASYHAFYITDTKLTLANNSGKARLLNANGQVVSETEVYQSAPDGEAWALIDDDWQWTLSPTPSAANILREPTTSVPQSKASSAKMLTFPKTSSKLTASSGKKASSKATTSAKTTAKASPATSADTALAEDTPASPHTAVLAVVGGLALLYAAYEYRNDLANKVYQLRRYRETRRAARQKS